MRLNLPVAAVVLMLAALDACGGSPASSPPVVATVTPTSAATVAPTPTASPTASPTPTPTPSLKIVNGAPLASQPVVLAKGRRTQSQAIAPSGLPLLVESAGTYILSAGPMIAWVTDLVSRKDVPEATGTVTAPGFAIDAPTMAALPCATLTAWCAAHPLAWTWGTDAVKPLGKQTLTVAFGDGTTAITTDFVYPGWALTCGTGWAFASGAIVPTATKAASDVFEDCTAGNVVFPRGGMLLSNPLSDQFGRFETIMPTITAAFIINSLFTNAPIVGIQPGIVFGINTQDGGFAKVYFSSPTQGLSLHANTDGTYAY